MEYMCAREAADKWGISQRRVAVLCSENRVEHAQMIGNMWIIPADAEKPLDARSRKSIEVDEKIAKPFLKWAGGKTQLLGEIRKYYPFENSGFTKYAEPFVGGGAVLFDILSCYDLEEIYISDTNAELINTYKVISNFVNDLIVMLKKYQTEYVLMNTDNRKDYYLRKRHMYNDMKLCKDEKINIEKAALLIFLNKTCFNGLYRVNKKGLFNVPMGAYKNPMICDEKNLLTVSQKLNKVIIRHGDFKESEKFIDKNTFVYLDPPYRPLTETSGFISYTESVFDDKKQMELAEFVNLVDKKGAKFLVSNSDPKNADENDEFFDVLYRNFSINRVKASRMINSKSEARGKICELLISNL